VVDTDSEENRNMVLIATAVGAAFKFFGSDRDDADDDVQGDHPTVRALFRAVNTGDFTELEDVIHEDCEAYANGYRLKSDSADCGPELMIATLKTIREELDDYAWELYDELSGKDDGIEKLAIRFVSSATIGGEHHEVEVAGFATIDDKLAEWREVLDMTLSNERREAAGLPTID
jgi:ketosteroid isomerase-like protein